MQKVQVQLAQLKNKIELIVPEQEVFTESLDEVTVLYLITVHSSLYINVMPLNEFNMLCSVLWCQLN